ncbi:CocE/NonD family hydrolase [Nocardioides albidus]|uniref:CocE/NonD family hydrolase n=1 Tax=Nocardioides albidus TaxID=1517589 RepID=A0A5C4WPE4_9ACTN|nr:CocE/NonD family hydrolase [Nocardioides albidus]TNM50137.1 CocE/NonD family hydrolase [Nocardioides albidus]
MNDLDARLAIDPRQRRRLGTALVTAAVAAALVVPLASGALGTSGASPAQHAASAHRSDAAAPAVERPKKCKKKVRRHRKCTRAAHAATPAPAAAPAAAASGAAAPAPAAPAPWTPRAADYDATVTTRDIAITMDDGVILRGDLQRPVGPDGEVVTTPLPVVVTITAYNKMVLSSGGGAVLSGADPAYLVKRGYAQLTVDARGTGTSQGQWAAFSAREGKDAGAIVEWAASQPWSNGKVVMTGASYMGISQLFAAAHRPKGLTAIFPQVPAADVYRDVVASGGQIDVGFIPLWLGLVTATGVLPPAYGLQEPEAGFRMALDHLMGGLTFTLPLAVQAILGGDPAYDGPFYRERSPIEVLDEVDVPTFLVGGEFDLFQRGTPLLFERLQQRGVPTRLVLGPWDHLQGSAGAEVGKAGYGTLAELQLRWFDHYVHGIDGRLDQIAPLTYYEQGSGAWVRRATWIDDDLSARSWQLSGSAAVGGSAGSLTTGTPSAGTAVVPPIPVTGLCTRSANQWTAGLPGTLLGDLPCFKDNRLNDLGGVTFDSAPQDGEIHFQGPLNARLYVSTPTGDGMLSVAVEDVAPDGTVSRLSGGWQTIAHRKLDESRSRYLDGQLLQAYHPFTREAKATLPAGEIAPVDVEIFPTGAVIAKGHRLRISVQAFDVPHLLSTATDLLAQLAPLTVHTGPQYPSVLTMAVR